ncbi:MAG: 3-methyladenine DNA glycosylase [Alphaproteobacteria bacterium]|nr:MAG: 3-methyladenine DNA glycosylase [Alphaproteobacteria bacterium]
MRSFEEIYAIAEARKPELEVLLAKGAKPKSARALAKVPDDRWLAQMTRSIFQSGFNWKVVEHMWKGFEEVFHGFDIGYCAMLHDEDFDRLVSDTRIVRHGPKIRAVQENAVFFSELRKEHGGVGKAIGGWPSEDYVGLLEMLKKRGTRLGGMTGQYAMRFMGVDSFILSRDVTARLQAENVFEGAATSKKSMSAIQSAFNSWAEESGRPLTEISRVLGYSIG